MISCSEISLSLICKAFIHSFNNVFWSEESYIVKFFLYPSFSISLLNILTQVEWNVDIHISSAFSPIKETTLSFISLAALFVNVMAKILYGNIFKSSIICAILCVSTLVLPEPAPAKISTGPLTVTAPSYCSLFNNAFKSKKTSSSPIYHCYYITIDSILLLLTFLLY